MVAAPRLARRLRRSSVGLVWCCLVLMMAVIGCGGGEELVAEESPVAIPGPEEDPAPRELSSFDQDTGLGASWTGDLDGMIEREVIRVLVVYNKTQYFIDQGMQRGATYEGLKEFENWLNKRLGRRTLKVEVVVLPVERDELIPALVDGMGDHRRCQPDGDTGAIGAGRFLEPASR